MSADDAPRNTARAAEIRRFVALHRASSINGPQVYKMTGYTDDHEGEQTAVLTVDLLLSAANALEAQGITGYAAARLTAAEHWGDEMHGDVILEVADTADDVLAEIRRNGGDRIVEATLEELAGEDGES